MVLDITVNLVLCRRVWYNWHPALILYLKFFSPIPQPVPISCLVSFWTKSAVSPKSFHWLLCWKLPALLLLTWKIIWHLKQWLNQVCMKLYKKSGLPPKIVLGVVAHVFHKFFDSKIEPQLSNHGFHLCLNIWDLDSREKIVGDC